jgi:hypothetical protein
MCCEAELLNSGRQAELTAILEAVGTVCGDVRAIRDPSHVAVAAEDGRDTETELAIRGEIVSGR